jgi:integrase
MAQTEWPKKIKAGNSVVTIYREKHPTYASGFRYKVWWTEAGQARHESRSTEPEATELARLKAKNLNAGHVEAASMTRSDLEELMAARAECAPVPLLSAIREWKQIHTKTGGQGIAAADAFAARHVSKFKPIMADVAVTEFITAKDKAGRQGTRTYGAKLKPLSEKFTGRELHLIHADEWDAYLERFVDGVTRNDFRKRAVALCRWAYKRKRMPQGAPLEIEQTERSTENPAEIGIIDSATFKRVLEWTRATNINLLAPVVLAGFCGIRVEEIHGKRGDTERRQLWSDVYLDRGYVRVTIAKTNTPSWRLVPLCAAAVEWLNLCPDREGVVCEHGALWKWRVLAREAVFKIPDNALRHSFISHRIAALDGNKQQVASEAGNSVKEIDKRYRVPLMKSEGLAWFELRPD